MEIEIKSHVEDQPKPEPTSGSPEKAKINTHQAIESDGSFQYVKKHLNDIIKYIQNNETINEYLQDIKMKASELADSLATIVKAFEEAHIKAKSVAPMEESMAKTWAFIEEYLRAIDYHHLDEKGKTVWFLQIQTKFSCTPVFLHSFKEYHDITNSPKEKYQQVWERIKIHKVKDFKTLIRNYRQLKKLMHTTAAAVVNQESHMFKVAKVCAFIFSFPQYYFMTDSAKLRSFQYYRNPTLPIAQKMWNLQEEGALRQFSKLTYDSITTNRKIYLPFDGKYTNRTDITVENPAAITVRVLYSKELKFYADGESMSCCVTGSKQPKEIDTVMLHLHGGGFIALSSRAMQVYTRKWANELDIPIFSVDYRKPPEYPFPTAPYDCLLAYQFLLEHAHKFMNVRPTNIYIAGDSAGGNLALSLTGLIMKNKMTIPKGLYLSYPAADLRMVFSSSKLNSITDTLLWPSSLLLCLSSYLVGDYKKADDPLASPVLLDQEYVNGTKDDKRFPLAWPKTLVTVGSKDPLLDDSLVLMERMVASKVDCECILYEELTHGYLNTEMIIEQARNAVKDSIDHLKQLINSTINQEGNKK